MPHSAVWFVFLPNNFLFTTDYRRERVSRTWVRLWPLFRRRHHTILNWICGLSCDFLFYLSTSEWFNLKEFPLINGLWKRVHFFLQPQHCLKEIFLLVLILCDFPCSILNILWGSSSKTRIMTASFCRLSDWPAGKCKCYWAGCLACTSLDNSRSLCWKEFSWVTLWFFPTVLFHPEGKSKKEKGAPIQRSTETGMAVELTRNMSRQPSRESNNGSMNSYNSEGKSVNHNLYPPPHTLHLPVLSFFCSNVLMLKGECQWLKMIVHLHLSIPILHSHLFMSSATFRSHNANFTLLKLL